MTSSKEIMKLINETIHGMPPGKALRYLFKLDLFLYRTVASVGKKLSGKGLHPKHKYTKYHNFFVNRIKHGEKVLDIGCGNGALTYDIAKKAMAKVVGVDMKPKAISQASTLHSHPNVRYQVLDASGTLPDGDFDVAVMSNVLEHIVDRVSLLKRVRRKAVRILIRVPTFERDWRVPLRRAVKAEWRLDSSHKTEYTLESFGQEMNTAKLKVTHFEVRWGEIWAEVT